MGFFDKIFGTHSQREIKRITPLVDKIEALRPDMQALSDEDFPARTAEFKERLAAGQTLDDILVEAFALCREAARRVLDMEPFRVQLIGGIILHQGRIAEMRTGEGKTLVATMPAYLNALEGKGVHVVTVNDYLAKRDAEWMGQIYQFLGLTVGVVLNSMTSAERQEAYGCDITYVTNNELGFDYLRDNMAIYKRQLVLRGLHFAIIDEVDSILIDEARTPLIISGQSGKSTKIYEACDILAKQMKRGEDMDDLSKIDAIMGIEQEETGDFIVNEKDKVVNLTAEGVSKVERFFHIENLADAENLEIQHCIILALRANNLMHLDHDYIVKDDQVLIVDEFTGRVMPGRRYSDGLHQAIEAKEHVKVKQESRTLATITFQNFFNKFDKKCGMAGTALTEEREFRDIYGMDVIEIPTNMPIQRVDLQDAVYKTKKEKYRAVVRAVKEAHDKGQPVLVGTITIQVSEELSKMLSREGIPHNVLNAKFHEQEAEIVAQAGVHGAVTIATNMAGRGTDIKLDDESRALGGLKIVGTERHESRRIDNQLRGRSGRQGDPGESRFYISLEDDLMRLFGAERMIDMFNTLQIPEDEELSHKMLTNTIENAQKKIESNNFGIRKNLLDYDQVMNEQREIIYKERRQVLDGESMRDSIFSMIYDIVDNAVNTSIGEDADPQEWDLAELNQLLLPVIPLQVITPERISAASRDGLKQELKEEAARLYESKEAEFPEPEAIREAERVILLKVVDRKWMNHIDDMEQLRQGIRLQSFAQHDPLVEYKIMGYDMFNEMTANIMQDTVRTLFHIRVEQKVEREEVAKVTGTNKDDTVQMKPKERAEKNVPSKFAAYDFRKGMIYMIQLDQMKLELQQYEAPMEEVRDSLDLDYKKQRIEELQRESEAPDFWMNADKANQKMKQLKDLQTTVEDADGLVNSYEEIMMMIEMGNEEEDESVVEEVRADLDAFEAKIEEMRLATLLTGEYDDSNAIISLNAGAGGTESCDWCSMLYRMYTKWADKKGFTIDVMNYVDGDEAGIKSVDFQINGTNAYGYLKSERGVHRLVRISPFNAQGKRQTSFVSCDVMPDIEKDIDIVINPDDIRIDTYRSSGAGGQHINKTSSAIRITHFPTGVVVTCQNERSQFQNKDKAMQMLKAKLYMLKKEEEEAKLAGIRGEVKDIAWGSQIRSYVLQPYTMVKDTRTQEETSNAAGVLNGDLDRFINAYLKMQAGKAERHEN